MLRLSKMVNTIHKKRGFTLIEVLVVTILIGILVLITAFNGKFAVDKADETAGIVSVGVYQVAIESVIRTSDYTPTSLQELADKLNSEVNDDFDVCVVNNHLESVSGTDRVGNKYKIYTDNFIDYTIECGNYTQKILVTKEGSTYEEGIHTD